MTDPLAQLGQRKAEQLFDDMYNYFADAEQREKAAAKRSDDHLSAHREGWKHLAEAVTGGLRLIADAIRDHNRR
jgi:hypothetical protein